MCGIAGILRTYPPGVAVPPRDESIREAWLDILDDSIKHRGPDGAGRFRDRVVRADGTTVDVALIHRRMAIIDLAGGHQPMLLKPEEPDAPDQVAVVFNGCIYNHRELRRELEGLGARFRTDHSDTEVLVWGWRLKRERLLDQLRGMGAMIIWDAREPALITHSLHPYEKPLYGTGWHKQRLSAYSSVAGGLLRLQSSLEEFRVHHVPYDPEAEVRSQVGSWLQLGYSESLRVASHDSCGLMRHATERVALSMADHAKTKEDIERAVVRGGFDWYFDKPRAFPFRPPTPEKLDARIATLVKERLEADVPVGAMLSGGVDSSLVVAHARKFLPSLQTYCVRMPVEAFDESEQAAAVAKLLGVHHTTVEVSSSVSDDLIRLIELAGIPFADSSLLPTYWAARAASERCKVVLTGDGADELFFGYERYRAMGVRDAISPIARWLPTFLLPRRDAKSTGDRVARLVDAARWGYESLLHIFPHAEMRELLPGAYSVEPNVRDIRGADAARAFDLDYTLPLDYLRKVDLATMAVPIESRAPFLDQQFMMEMKPLESGEAMRGGRLKALLKDALKLHLPAALVDRPKMGFAIPLADWFRSDCGSLRTLLGDLVINAQDPFPADILGCELNRVFIRELFDQHMSGKRDHAQRLYALLVMAIWCRWYQRILRAGGASGPIGA